MSKAAGFVGLALMALILVGCGGTPEDRSDITMDLSLVPDPPRVGPAEVIITLRNEDSMPVQEAGVRVEATMTHAGMVPVFAEASEVAPGRYPAMLEFTMGGGDWVIVVGAELADGRSLERQFEVPGVKAR
jgi:hypothetical protein